MTFRERLGSAFSGTSLEAPLSAVDDLYRQADAAAAEWAKTGGLACGEGCGKCCERFVPDLQYGEALYLAAWIALERPSGMDALERFDGARCPLYLEDEPRHCPVYPARPLICRMFGMSGVRGKDGEPEFTLCFAMRPEDPVRTRHGPEIPAEFAAMPPLVSDFGMRMASILPDRTHERLLLPRAVREAADRIKATLSYLGA